MSRLIDADAFVEAIKGVEVSWYLDGNYTTYDETTIMDIIKQQPTVEAVPVVHGEWIPVPSSDTSTGKAYECSNCKKMRYGSFLPPFCQMCGADMRKKVEE